MTQDRNQFYRTLTIVASMMTLIGIANAQDGKFIQSLLIPDLPAQAQYRTMIEDISGIWVTVVDGQISGSVEIQADGNMLYGRRLSEIKLQFVRPSPTIGELIETIAAEKAFADAELAKTRANSAERTVGERAIGLLENLDWIARDAKARGANIVPAGDYSIRWKDQFGNLDGEQKTIAYTDFRLYEYSALTRVVYDRVDALEGALAEQWSTRWQRGHANRINAEYNELYNQCVRLQRRRESVDECHDWRDRLLKFGATPKPEFVLEGERQFPVMSAAEKAFWKAPVSGDAPIMNYEFPFLDYCYSQKESGTDRRKFHAALAERGYRNTLWAFSREPEIPREQPANWSEEEFREFRSVRLDVGQELVFFRADGTLVYRGRIDPRNRWSADEEAIRISWHDGTFTSTFPLVNGQPTFGQSTFDYIGRHALSLFEADYWFLSYQHLWPYPEDQQYRGFVDQWMTQSCTEGSFVRDVELENVTVAELPRTPVATTSETVAAAASAGDPGAPVGRPSATATLKATRPSEENVTTKAVQTLTRQLPPPVETPAPAADTDPLVGCWQWSNGIRVVVDANGNANNGFGNAPWTKKAGSQFEIDWPDFTGTITLSDDGQSLNGLDSLGVRSTAKRVQGGPGSFVGVWQWDNGGLVTIGEDGSMAVGTLRGNWQGSGRKYTIVWPIVDDIYLSADGNSLSGQNQFGAFTAKKQLDCH